MPLKALDIYKILPKKNCKECGDPTCLTFAMKLASGKGDVTKCPYLDDEAKRVLGASTRPPISLVKIGVGEKRFAVGEEFVLFRHEKTFYHQPGIMVDVPDTLPDTEIRALAARVADARIVRIGADLRCNGLAIRNVSGSPSRFGEAVAAAESAATDLPEVLIADDPAAQEAGLASCGHFRPLICAATVQNRAAMTSLARKYGCPLVVNAPDLPGLAGLVKECTADGVSQLLLDLTPQAVSGYISASTLVRRSAICRSQPELGYPVFVDTARSGSDDTLLILGILKYGSVIATRELPPSSLKAALTLRQNIYTDPQKPIQMNPGIYPVGNPGKDSPVLLTVNFSLTFFTVQGYLEAARIPCYMLIVDTEGMSVLTAVAAGKLSETLVRESLKKFKLDELVSHRRLIIPGYAAPLSGKIEEETGWKVLVGPRDAAEVGEYLEQEWKP